MVTGPHLVRSVAAALGLTLALGSGLAGCGNSPGPGDLSASRDAVRTAAERDLPAVVASLGGQVRDAWGAYEFGGDGILDRRAYAVTVVVDGGDTDPDAIAAAFEDAGYAIDQHNDSGIVGVRDDMSLRTPLPRGATVRLGLHGPWFETVEGTPREVRRERIELGGD